VGLISSGEVDQMAKKKGLKKGKKLGGTKVLVKTVSW
jgi:hypothetical protein